jgi:adenylylsulfate kinase
VTFAVWLTGLSGSGKSAIARVLVAELESRSIGVAVLESDVLRTQLTPHATYDAADRDFFYANLAAIGALLVDQGRPVVIDATANLRRYRDAARAQIARFCEVYVDTPLAVCRQRDPKGLYKDARNLPGVQAPYEAPVKPELTVHGERGTPQDAAKTILAYLERQGWLA